MYIQHAPSEITKINKKNVSILHWPSITDCWHRHTQTSHKVKTVFQYARGYIYSGRCCQDKTKKHANKYTLRAPLSGTFPQTLSDLVTRRGQRSPKGSGTKKDCRSNLAPRHARKHETHSPRVKNRVPSRFKRLWFYLCWCKPCWRL